MWSMHRDYAEGGGTGSVVKTLWIYPIVPTQSVCSRTVEVKGKTDS
jgi:hypothetical protein